MEAEITLRCSKAYHVI